MYVIVLSYLLKKEIMLYYGLFLSNMSSRTETYVINNEVGRTCGTIGRQDRCILGFGGETWGKETT